MKIYFGASVTFDRSMLPVYRKIVTILKELGHEVLSEHVVDPKLIPGAGLTAEKLFQKETKAIEEADVMVAEVTSPSWGTAFLMEHALEKNKPVLALFYQEVEQPLPLMIKGHPELYLEHYDEDSVRTILEKTLSHFASMEDRKGKLVVIDGADGSGKSTQTKLLLKYLKKHNFKNRYISFPRYYTSFHGRHVGRFLRGEFSHEGAGAAEISPYLSSLAFALDRLTARDQIVEWLSEGNVVVADRYVSASMAHQGSKLPKENQREFVDWLYSMEYKEHKLPKEDVVIYLHVPVDTAQKLMKEQGREVDTADKDIHHQKLTVEMYKNLVARYKHWQILECIDEHGQLLSIDEIHKKILDILHKKKII
jgi:dTMP kinase